MISVTIGLPVYNGANYLEPALASLAAQTMQDLQFLISDNASTDATPEILAKWAAKDSRIKYHRQPRNIGGYPNFKWVLNNAGSHWFSFAAHDDLWSPDFVQSLYKAITAKPGIVLAVPQVITMFEDGSEDMRRPVPDEMSEGTRTDRIRCALDEARGGWYNGLWNREALISAIDQTKSFSHVWGHDLITLLPPMLSAAIVSSNDAIYYKRQTLLSDQRYRPKTARDQFLLYSEFLRASLNALKAAPLSPTEKIRLLPSIVGYARHGEKPWRILKTAIREALQVVRNGVNHPTREL
jgi:glycosyltransferase involved in cell wall biosynthesis